MPTPTMFYTVTRKTRPNYHDNMTRSNLNEQQIQLTNVPSRTAPDAENTNAGVIFLLADLITRTNSLNDQGTCYENTDQQ